MKVPCWNGWPQKATRWPGSTQPLQGSQPNARRRREARADNEAQERPPAGERRPAVICKIPPTDSRFLSPARPDRGPDYGDTRRWRHAHGAGCHKLPDGRNGRSSAPSGQAYEEYPLSARRSALNRHALLGEVCRPLPATIKRQLDWALVGRPSTGWEAASQGRAQPPSNSWPIARRELRPTIPSSARL